MNRARPEGPTQLLQNSLESLTREEETERGDVSRVQKVRPVLFFCLKSGEIPICDKLNPLRRSARSSSFQCQRQPARAYSFADRIVNGFVFSMGCKMRLAVRYCSFKMDSSGQSGSAMCHTTDCCCALNLAVSCARWHAQCRFSMYKSPVGRPCDE